MMMMQYPLVLSDIDGTLVNNEGTIPDKVVSAIQEYSQAGGHFVLASARPPLAMLDLAQSLGLAVPMVALNGSLIVEYVPEAGGYTWQIVSEQPLYARVPIQLWQMIVEHQLPVSINVYSGLAWLANQHDQWNAQEAAITGTNPIIVPLAQRLAAGLTTHKILCMADPAVIDQLSALLAQRPDWHLNASRSKPTYLEVSDASVSKQSALHTLARHFDIPVTQTMAIGDGENDLPMLTAAGLSIAMGNSFTSVKEKATHIVATNDQGGVAEALQDYAMTEEAVTMS
ncbi:Cof-type HAD-IIB family hydrolase [Schleiferilactobacillus perolens]|uniref:Cof protein n=1 Tax=Schleiferilactobacillus perolens DSM 12744 TaxID=1423792 RepID=A0A0R1N0Q0_9LACO|nr:Cof-type HAD-IIB family hydrolase [Schleiferilactobacillus perolens]KRL11090.1 Cof protein [Schleiferilactobacillus perolens DSM 12744]